MKDSIAWKMAQPQSCRRTLSRTHDRYVQLCPYDLVGKPSEVLILGISGGQVQVPPATCNQDILGVHNNAQQAAAALRCNRPPCNAMRGVTTGTRPPLVSGCNGHLSALPEPELVTARKPGCGVHQFSRNLVSSMGCGMLGRFLARVINRKNAFSQTKLMKTDGAT